jgi:L-gulonolactone oxidase
LRRLNQLLAEAGLALTNLGDIDAQTVAGAISTGTHGTGVRFGGIATQVVGLELVTADGSLVSCSAAPGERPELFEAARVGLGALGIITAVTFAAVPLFALRADEGPIGMDELLGRFDELAEGTDHFEAYWFPHTGQAMTKRNTRLDLRAGLERLPRWKEWLDDELLANGVFGALVSAGRRVPTLIPAINRLVAKGSGHRTFTDLSYRVFTSPRRVRFVEMEYAISRSDAVAAIRDLVHAVEGSGLRVAFPVELRIAAADDIPLSTASGRDSAYIAVHMPAQVDPEPYFSLVASVLDGYGGRPHWGKVHFLAAERLRLRYPRFDDFLVQRDALDPTGVFTNAYVDRVLGPPPG